MGKVSEPKNRCDGEWTEAKFWGFIRGLLRKGMLRWKPKHVALEESRRPNESENRRLKWEYQCENCAGWFPKKEIQVHHRIEAGELRRAEDLPQFVERMFCEAQGFLIVCIGCHRVIEATKKEERNG